MSDAYGIQFFLESLHADHVDLFIFGEVEDLGQVQGGREAGIEEFILMRGNKRWQG
jgi:hypothetical protein